MKALAVNLPTGFDTLPPTVAALLRVTATSAAPSTNAFHSPAYVKYLAALVCHSFATQIVVVAVGWQVYDITRDPSGTLGLIGLSQFLPALLLVLVTGLVADRFNRRLILALCLALEAACAVAFVLFTLSNPQDVTPGLRHSCRARPVTGLFLARCRRARAQPVATRGHSPWHFAQLHELAGDHHHGQVLGGLLMASRVLPPTMQRRCWWCSRCCACCGSVQHNRPTGWRRRPSTRYSPEF